jgi:hypothetical protein
MVENTNLSQEHSVPDFDSSATWSVRYIDPSGGFECLLSLDASSGMDVLKKAQRALEKLLESKCTPITHNSISPSIKEADKDSTSYCVLHRSPMRQFQKNGRSWHAHRTETGEWCKGVK